jgi:hypothetical protein
VAIDFNLSIGPYSKSKKGFSLVAFTDNLGVLFSSNIHCDAANLYWLDCSHNIEVYEVRVYD